VTMTVRAAAPRKPLTGGARNPASHHGAVGMRRGAIVPPEPNLRGCQPISVLSGVQASPIG
jgi:hypothetical protein